MDLEKFQTMTPLEMREYCARLKAVWQMGVLGEQMAILQEKERDRNRKYQEACSKNDYNTVVKYFDHVKESEQAWGFMEACEKGHKDIVECLLCRSSIKDYAAAGLHLAFDYNQVQLFDILFKECIKTCDEISWSLILEESILHNHFQYIVKLLVQHNKLNILAHSDKTQQEYIRILSKNLAIPSELIKMTYEYAVK
jgi:hypothetical protein